jgi:hypothetical protein
MQKYWIVGAVLLSAGVCHTQKAREPADVIVYVKAASVPSPVNYGARSQVTWMFNEIGVRIVWRDGVPGPTNRQEETWVIKVDFNSHVPPDEHPRALAYAMPFSQGASAITVMYDRLQFAVAARPRLEEGVLAHVLAHELGHILQGSNQHSRAGIMKAHWTAQDYDAMAKRPLSFTPVDFDLIHEGLRVHKARAGVE